MMYSKLCECCGKRFLSKSNLKKYCSKECERVAANRRREYDKQLCWRCKNACGGCDWSKRFIPVDGWIAEQTIVKDANGDFLSYKIKKCPKFTRN